jgi:hypothetical protein
MKKRTVLILVVMTSLVACGGGIDSTAPSSAPGPSPTSTALDGRSYDVTLEAPDEAPKKDTLRFSSGKFESSACTALGFPEWSDYAAQAKGNEIAFQATTRHPSGTTLSWNGSIQGDAVDGTANRTMNGKTDVLHFKGSTSH